MDRCPGAVEFNALKLAGQEAGRPLPRRNWLGISSPNAGHHHKAWKLLRFKTEPISDPGAHRRSTTESSAGVHKCVSGIMIDLFGDHRTNHTEVIRHFAMPWQKIADQLAALTAGTKSGERSKTTQFLPLQLRDRLPLRVGLRHRLPVHSLQLRFEIKSFKLRWSPDI